MKVYANINTLKKAKAILNDCGLDALLGGDEKEFNLLKIIDMLIEKDILVEFLQVITRDNETDFAEMEMEEIGVIIESFFQNISKILPGAMRTQLAKVFKVQLEKTSTSTTSTSSNN